MEDNRLTNRRTRALPSREIRVFVCLLWHEKELGTLHVFCLVYYDNERSLNPSMKRKGVVFLSPKSRLSSLKWRTKIEKRKKRDKSTQKSQDYDGIRARFLTKGLKPKTRCWNVGGGSFVYTWQVMNEVWHEKSAEVREVLRVIFDWWRCICVVFHDKTVGGRRLVRGNRKTSDGSSVNYGCALFSPGFCFCFDLFLFRLFCSFFSQAKLY